MSFAIPLHLIALRTTLQLTSIGRRFACTNISIHALSDCSAKIIEQCYVMCPCNDSKLSVILAPIYF
jgi:hypothetical protein